MVHFSSLFFNLATLLSFYIPSGNFPGSAQGQYEFQGQYEVTAQSHSEVVVLFNDQQRLHVKELQHAGYQCVRSLGNQTLCEKFVAISEPNILNAKVQATFAGYSVQFAEPSEPSIVQDTPDFKQWIVGQKVSLMDPRKIEPVSFTEVLYELVQGVAKIYPGGLENSKQVMFQPASEGLTFQWDYSIAKDRFEWNTYFIRVKLPKVTP